MKIISASIQPPIDLGTGKILPIPPIVQDITVTVEHEDGTQASYAVRNKAQLAQQVQQYLQWQSDLRELQAMQGTDFNL